ncbi:MAG: hypothetical protein ISQ34_02470 [Rickettsiales bacterium]|nr:hypothetical protein [Rickettsiales bacterium]
MTKRFFQQILIIFFLICTSCAKPKPNPFLLSPNPSLQILELKDHQFCSSLKIDYNQSDLMHNSSYWGCRLSISKNHIIKSRSSHSITHNAGLQDLIRKIDIKIQNLPENLVLHANKQTDTRHHNKCLELGYEVATQDSAKIDDYFSCRSTLLENYKLLPPYRKPQYMKYPNNSYNLNFAINNHIEKRLEEYNKQKEKYPECIKYNLYDPNFKLCTKAQDESKICHNEIKTLRYKKELKDKLRCQRQTYIHFPNRLIKADEDEQSNINKQNNKSDYYNQNNFAALGIDEAVFKSPDSLEEEKNQEELEEEKSSINNNNELYTKFEITKLREKFILKCQARVDEEIIKFIEEEKFKCNQLKKFEKIGE